MPNLSTSPTAVALLTYKRNYLLERQLQALALWHEKLAEVIIVDNANEASTRELCAKYPWARLIQAQENLGAAGRNLAFESCRARYLVTLDDDVLEFKEEHLPVIEQLFEDEAIACVNFKVIEEGTGRIVNWVHHRAPDKFAEKQFDTYEITEGAAAFRLDCLKEVGGYPESFFLSHEGPDLAWRLMDRSWRVIYSPAVAVTHLFAPEGRASWRNYYYDTRNTVWLALRHLPLGYGTKLVVRQNSAMAFYSLRDGFIGTWFRAWRDALKGAGAALKTRKCLRKSTLQRLTEIDEFRPSLLKTIWVRLRTVSPKLGAE